MNDLLSRLATHLADYYLAGGILMAGSLLASVMLRQPARRILVTRAVLIGLVVLAAVLASPWEPWFSWPWISTAPTNSAGANGVSPTPREGQALPDTPLAKNRPEAEATVERDPIWVHRSPYGGRSFSSAEAELFQWPGWHMLAIAVYSAGVLVAAAWLAAGWQGAIRLRRRAVPASLPLCGELLEVIRDGSPPPELLTSGDVAGPVAMGLWRPAILIPDALVAATDPAGRKLILAHEWAHIGNKDLWFLALDRVLLVALFAHPLYWWLRRLVRRDQELLADAGAAGLAGRNYYAAELVRWSRLGHRTAPRHAAALGIFERPNVLSRRIAMLLDDTFQVETRCSRRWHWAAGVLVLTAILTLSLFTFRPVASAAEDPPGGGAAPAAAENTAEPPAAAERPAPREYSGTVRDQDTGAPIEGATVTVRRSTLSSTQRRLIEETRHQTDAAGIFRFTIPAEQVAERFLYIELDVEHPDYAPRKGFGYALSMIIKNETLGGRPFFEEVKLRPAEKFIATVLAPDGKPAEGVPVMAYSRPPNTELSDEYGSFAEAKTDAEGRFVVNIVKGGDAIVWILPETHAPTSLLIDEKRGDLGPIQLVPGQRLRGRVLAADGQPVAGVWVNAEADHRTNETGSLPVASQIGRAALTDDQGQFVLAPLPAGTYRLAVAERPDDYFHRGAEPRPVPGVFQHLEAEIGDVEPGPIEIRAVPHVTIEGQFFDSQGKPRRSHRPYLIGKLNGDEFYFVEASADETGKLSALAPKGLKDAYLDLITNEHSALRHRRGDGPLENSRKLELGTLEEDVKDIEIIRYEAPIVIVKAVDETGKPMEKFQVSAKYPPRRKQIDTEFILEGDLLSDLSFERQKDGRWRSSQLLPDEKITVTAHAEGYAPASQEVSLGEGEQKEIEIVLKPGVDDTKRFERRIDLKR